MTHLTATPQASAGRRAFLMATGIASAALVSASALRPARAEDVAASPAAKTAPVDISTLPRVRQAMVDPPFLPEHEQVASTGPRIVEIILPIIEKKMVIDDEGTEVWALTYNGSVPGPMIVVHEGDYVEVTLKNIAENAMEHNIDFMRRPARWAAAP